MFHRVRAKGRAQSSPWTIRSSSSSYSTPKTWHSGTACTACTCHCALLAPLPKCSLAAGPAAALPSEEPQQAQLISIADDASAPQLPPVNTAAASGSQHPPHSVSGPAPAAQAFSTPEPRSGQATPPRAQEDTLRSAQSQLAEAMAKIVSLTATCRSQQHQLSQLQVRRCSWARECCCPGQDLPDVPCECTLACRSIDSLSRRLCKPAKYRICAIEHAIWPQHDVSSPQILSDVLGMPRCLPMQLSCSCCCQPPCQAAVRLHAQQDGHSPALGVRRLRMQA